MLLYIVPGGGGGGGGGVRFHRSGEQLNNPIYILGCVGLGTGHQMRGVYSHIPSGGSIVSYPDPQSHSCGWITSPLRGKRFAVIHSALNYTMTTLMTIQ